MNSVNSCGYVDNKLGLSFDTFPVAFSHCGMASGNPVMGKTAQPVAPWPADKNSVRVPFGRARRWAGRLARLRVGNLVNIPVGYEDETGFHYGIPDNPKNPK